MQKHAQQEDSRQKRFLFGGALGAGTGAALGLGAAQAENAISHVLAKKELAKQIADHNQGISKLKKAKVKDLSRRLEGQKMQNVIAQLKNPKARAALGIAAALGGAIGARSLAWGHEKRANAAQTVLKSAVKRFKPLELKRLTNEALASSNLSKATKIGEGLGTLKFL